MHTDIWLVIGIICASVCLGIAVFALPGCSERRGNPTDPNAFSAKTFWSAKERWSGGDGAAGGP